MKKVWLVAGFMAVAGLLTGVSGEVMHAAMFEDDWVEKGSFSVENEDGYPENNQGMGQESVVVASFNVYTPFLYNAKEDKSEALYSVNQARIVLSGADGYATAAGGEQWFFFGANKTNVYAKYGRLKSGVKYTQGCFVELVPTSYGQALGYKRCWDVCTSPGSVTSNGTDVTGRGYFRTTGDMTYQNPAVVFEGGGVVRVEANANGVQAVGNGFNYDYGTGARLTVVHSPLNSAVRVDFTDGMDPNDLTWSTSVWSQRVVVKDCDEISKASSLVHRAYLVFDTPGPGGNGYQEAFSLPSPGIAIKTSVDGLTITVPMNQQ
jgi:hypothetical protein